MHLKDHFNVNIELLLKDLDTVEEREINIVRLAFLCGTGAVLVEAFDRDYISSAAIKELKSELDVLYAEAKSHKAKHS